MQQAKEETKTVTKVYSWGAGTKNMVKYEEEGQKGTRLMPTPYMAKESLLQEFGGRLPKGFRITFEPLFD